MKVGLGRCAGVEGFNPALSVKQVNLNFILNSTGSQRIWGGGWGRCSLWDT